MYKIDVWNCKRNVELTENDGQIEKKNIPCQEEGCSGHGVMKWLET